MGILIVKSGCDKFENFLRDARMTRKKILAAFKRSDAHARSLVLDLEAVIRWWGDGIRRKDGICGTRGTNIFEKEKFLRLTRTILKDKMVQRWHSSINTSRAL